MSVKSLKTFGPPTIKWRPCKKFSEIERKPSFIFKLQGYQTFALMKCIIWAKSDLPVTSWVCEKVWFTINGSSKMIFFNFCLFSFSKFQMTFCHKPYNGFRGVLWSSTKSHLFLILFLYFTREPEKYFSSEIMQKMRQGHQFQISLFFKKLRKMR